MPIFFACLFSFFWLFSATEEPPTMIFAHGLADTYRQAYIWGKSTTKDRPYLHDGEIITFNFPDSTEYFWRVNFPWTSLGQDNEIATLKETVDTFQQKYPEKKIILAGVSRGAATVLNYLALHQPKNIAAVLLESPFSSMRDVAQKIVSSTMLNAIPYAYEVSPYLVSCIFWQYSDNSIHPIDSIKKINTEIPIMFMSREDDYLVPSSLTQKLVDELYANGHTKTHHLQIKAGQHGKHILGPDGERMQCIVHAFYNYYNLPCVLEFAQKGMQDFLLT